MAARKSLRQRDPIPDWAGSRQMPLLTREVLINIVSRYGYTAKDVDRVIQGAKENK